LPFVRRCQSCSGPLAGVLAVNNFLPLRELHAFCVKFSRGSGRRQIIFCAFIGVSANNAVGTAGAKWSLETNRQVL
jgi:hypothetical protein